MGWIAKANEGLEIKKRQWQNSYPNLLNALTSEVGILGMKACIYIQTMRPRDLTAAVVLYNIGFQFNIRKCHDLQKQMNNIYKAHQLKYVLSPILMFCWLLNNSQMQNNTEQLHQEQLAHLILPRRLFYYQHTFPGLLHFAPRYSVKTIPNRSRFTLQ